jgi:hypothetical protein
VAKTLESTTDPRDAYARLLARVERMTADVPSGVRDQIAEAATSELDAAVADAMLERVLGALLSWADTTGDAELAEHLRANAEALGQEIRGLRASRNGGEGKVTLQPRGDGFKVHRVIPPPIFNGREVKVWAGYLPARDIDQWDGNERLQVHIEQFTESRGRRPSADEILEIMLTKMSLPGIEDKDDQFKIQLLAGSIARNGVRTPPIIDHRGRLLDGNRRVAACRYILDADPSEFGTEAKERAEWVPVWMLDEGTTPPEAEHVVITLNFEDKTKEEWPKYVRARKVAEHYERRGRLEPGRDERRDRQLKREVADYFGIKTPQVTSYLKMVRLAQEFEEHQVQSRHRDPHAVAHKASAYFEYFDELSKGESSGVNFVLNKDDELRRLVFDLLFEDKFVRFSQIRHLKHLPESPDAIRELQRARDEKEPTEERLDELQRRVDDALTSAAAAAKERRQMDPNTRIENFVSWLKAVPVSTFQEKVDTDNLVALREALELANRLVEPALAARGES